MLMQKLLFIWGLTLSTIAMAQQVPTQQQNQQQGQQQQNQQQPTQSQRRLVHPGMQGNVIERQQEHSNQMHQQRQPEASGESTSGGNDQSSGS